jgi:glycosyltransferase involved in cell wall biosynthesis
MTVSVAIITYNHAAFIAECLDSILMQETDFEWEIVIAEDASTDGTRDICKRYANLYPEKIRLLPESPNLGMIRNFTRVFEACRGAYMAFTEGDDFWTDKYKLQKQINHLESHPHQSLCFHSVRQWFVWNGENNARTFPENLAKNTFTTEDLLQGWFVPSTSVVLRIYADFTLPDWFAYCKSGDIPLLLLLSLRGPFGYINESMAVYRIHDHGVSRTHRGYQKISAMVFILENFNIYSDFRFKDEIAQSIIREIDLHYPGQPKAATLHTPAKTKQEMSAIQKLLSLPKRLIRKHAAQAAN